MPALGGLLDRMGEILGHGCSLRSRVSTGDGDGPRDYALLLRMGTEQWGNP
jgi:hypothetical protein